MSSEWNTNDTKRLFLVIENVGAYRAELDEHIEELRRAGYSKKDALIELNSYLYFLVDDECAKSRRASQMASRLIGVHPCHLDIDYGQLAEHYLEGYAPSKSGGATKSKGSANRKTRSSAKAGSGRR